MGWFSSAAPTGGTSGAGSKNPAAPDRSERQACWDARDSYFACLDKNNITDAIKDAGAASSACPKENAEFNRDCASSWVEYFKKQRVQNDKKARLMKQLEAEGAIGVDLGAGKPPAR